MSGECAERLVRLNKLIDEGLDFGECVEAFYARQTPEQNRLAMRAAEKHEEEGEVEVDPNAIVSGSGEDGDEGAYVMGWLWIEAETEEEEEA